MKLTLERASTEFGVSKETLRRGLSTIGLKTGRGIQYDIATIYRALSGDLKSARAREANASADAKERENKIADREVLPIAEVQTWMDKVLLPIRQRILGLPSSLASRCNPADPAFAQAALDQWVDETLPILRKEIL